MAVLLEFALEKYRGVEILNLEGCLHRGEAAAIAVVDGFLLVNFAWLLKRDKEDCSKWIEVKDRLTYVTPLEIYSVGLDDGDNELRLSSPITGQTIVFAGPFVE